MNLELINQIRTADESNPLRILMSACLAGIACGYDGSTNGEYPAALKILTYPTAKIIRFCPEEYSFGSPREMCDIYGGTGSDVLAGKAKVLTESGKDWTSGMIKAAEKMLALAKQEKIEIAVMMDISAACGSTVIYSGNRFAENKVYQIGEGVCAALLRKNDIPVISQRDFASLEILYSKLDSNHQINPEMINHVDTAWYKKYFQ